MVREASHPKNSHPADQKFIAQIKTHGWNVTNIFRREGETGPEWSFSTGLFHTFQHPEIVIFGLELDNMQKIVNVIGTEIKGGEKFEPGIEYQNVFARVAANSGVSTPVAMRITWAGRSGSTTPTHFRSCNVSGRIARDIILGIQAALLASSNCSRFFSSIRESKHKVRRLCSG